MVKLLLMLLIVNNDNDTAAWEIEIKRHEMVIDFSSNPSYITNCMGIEPRITGCKSDTLPQD